MRRASISAALIFLFLMMNEFEEWSFDLEEITSAESLHEKQKKCWKYLDNTQDIKKHIFMTQSDKATVMIISGYNIFMV